MSGHRALEDSDLALIGRVKMTPALYDPRNPDFRLAYRKEQEWEVVGAMVGMSAVEARRRWTCLRDRYSRELKQLRTHPENNEYGNNPFFRQMDFLRRYVRKRRNRRRNAFIEYENKSEDGHSITKIEHIIHLQNKAEISRVEDDEDYSLDNYNEAKADSYAENTMESDYPEFVDVDAGEVYEECVETPLSEANIKHQAASDFSTSVSSKQLDSTIVPFVATQHNPNRAVYTLSTSQAQQQMPSMTDIPTESNVGQHKQNQHLYANAQTSSHQAHLQSQQCSTNSYPTTAVPETEDDLFGKSVAVYLRQLSRRHKIKAQVEMFQILEKYIELEENAKMVSNMKTSK